MRTDLEVVRELIGASPCPGRVIVVNDPEQMTVALFAKRVRDGETLMLEPHRAERVVAVLEALG